MKVGDKVRIRGTEYVGIVNDTPWWTAMVVVSDVIDGPCRWKAMYSVDELELVEEA